MATNNHYARFGPVTSNIFRKMVALPAVIWEDDKKDEEDKLCSWIFFFRSDYWDILYFLLVDSSCSIALSETVVFFGIRIIK